MMITVGKSNCPTIYVKFPGYVLRNVFIRSVSTLNVEYL